MPWYEGLVNGGSAQVNERGNGQVEAIYNFSSSSHDHIVSTPDGVNAAYVREGGEVIVDNNATNAYPDTTK